jgi:nucleotide-binding universal stress UspA family protein
MGKFKSILVHYDASHAAVQRLEAALQVARMFDARIACLFALDEVGPPASEDARRRIFLEMVQQMRHEEMSRARASYDACIRRAGFEAAEWRSTDADALATVALHARYADLVVIGQHHADKPGGVARGFEWKLPLEAGRPVLVVPYAYEPKPLGKRVLIAWNASREAARAVSDALPLLERASQVHVVTVNAEASARGHGEEPGADIAQFLSRHGVKVTVSQLVAPDLDAGNALLSRAFDLQADLIVSGAWGHTRLRESVLGGVTRTLLESMTVPVLMSH